MPSYAWQYRPEYQFSQFDFEVKGIERTVTDENGDEQIIDILYLDNPTIASSDDYITALYSLISNEFDALNPIDGGQELVLALGEQEQRITLGDDQSIRFGDIASLASLDVEDFLTMRLYGNNDAGNILWEYAFLYLTIGIADDKTALIGHDVAYVSADNPSIDISTAVLGYASLQDSQKADFPNRVRWIVKSGNASFSPSVTPLNAFGSSRATLNIDPKVGNIVQIEAHLLGEEDAHARLFDIGILPGEPANIQLSHTGEAFIRRKGSIEIKAEVSDQHNNLVQNGTGVQLNEYGHINLVSTTGLTDKGAIVGKIVGGGRSGSYKVKASSGNVEAEINVDIKTMGVEILNLPSVMDSGGRYFGSAKINAASSLGGVYVDVGAQSGEVVVANSKTNQLGEVVFEYFDPNEPGEYALYAKVDLETPVSHTFTVLASQQNRAQGASSQINGNVQLDNYLLVSGLNGSGELTSTTYTGDEVIASVDSEIEVSLLGQAGESWELDLNSLHLVNRAPLYFSRFFSISMDESRHVKATYSGVQQVSSLYPHLRALNFDSASSEWSVDKAVKKKPKQPSINFWAHPEGQGRIASVFGGEFEIEYVGSEFKATYKTGEESFVASVPGIVPDQWYAISVGVIDGDFYFAVDDAVEIIPINVNSNSGGVTSISPLGLKFGDSLQSFSGRIAGPRIYDWQSEPLLELSDESGVFDSSGVSTINLQLSEFSKENDANIAVVTIDLNGSQNNNIKLNIVSSAAGRSFLTSYSEAMSINNIDFNSIMSRMPLNQVFADTSRSSGQLSMSFAGQKNSESAKQNVVSNLGWIKEKLRYKELNKHIPILQRYFVGKSALISEFAADYLQEAVVESSFGNDFWIRTMSTGLIVWSELIEVRPDLADKVAASIKSRSDFWTWIKVMSLPANGWVTDVIPIPRHNVTCDKVVPDININTLLEYSTEPCRATGGQMAFLIDSFVDGDELSAAAPEFLTLYMKTLLQSMKEAPLELKKLFPPIGSTIALSQTAFIAEAEAPIWFYVVRGVAIAIKQAIRKGAGGSPANFVAFLQGGTTSRVDRVEMLMALAYLGSRLDGTDICQNCKKLNEQVSDTIISDMGVWFAGLGLAKKGEITTQEDKRRTCTVTNGAHGKGFELLATAAYHALYEFGGAVGVSNPDKYEILLSDPSKGDDIIDVAIMKEGKGFFGGVDFDHYTESPFQRKPDLVLHGVGEKKRVWVEFKSWLYRKSYSGVNNRLKDTEFKVWDGVSKGGTFRANANRQHFLDYVATTSALNEAYWEDEGDDLYNLKPSENIAWIQVWKAGKRTWRALEKNSAGKYRLSKKNTVRNVATPWIDSDDVIRTVPKNFQALQRFLTEPPSGLSNTVFKDTTGVDISEYKTKYQKRQISKNLSDLKNSSVAPFNLATFFAVEAGDAAKDKLLERLFKEFGDDRFAELQTAISTGKLSEEQIEELREEITTQMEELLGPLKILAVDIPLLSDIENAVADLALGEEVDAIREAASNMELNESLFENVCEAI